MFKNIALIISLILLGISPHLLAQTTVKITYKTEPILQGSLDGKSENMKVIVKKIIDHAKKTKYVLLTSPKESFFKKEEVMSKGDKTTYEKIFKEGASRFTGFHEKLYSDYQKTQIIFIQNLAGKEVVVKKQFHDFEWKIKKSSKSILGFATKKAESTYHDPITGDSHTIIAWFAPSIPIRSGPDIFTGLPGLILELELPKAVITAETIEEDEKLEIKKLNDKDALTQKEYEKLISKLNKKLIDK